jgi:hypothetical protein
MRTLRLSALIVLLAVGLVTLAARPVQDLPDPADMAEMMRQAQPGPEHAELARYVGEWEGTVLIHSPDAPEAEPMTLRATATNRMILGGRFLEMVSKGDVMGQPFESVGMFGFDRRNDVWTTVGFDTLGTYWVTGSGKRDEAGVIRMHGTDSAPTGDQIYFFELTLVSDDEFLSSVYFTQIGPTKYDEPFKMVEIRYTRS